MSRVTSHVGFGLTYASTFMHPFYVARLLNSLDHITNGRIAFNVISSQRRSDYENYGYDELIDHGERYDRMEEFIAVCKARWSSVDADAFVWDRLNGLVADPAKVRPINHVGRFFKAKGPLSVVPSPQGHPVLIQAGGSKRGIWAAAGFVDHVFGAGKGIRLMAQQRDDMDAALRDRGPDTEQVGIVWATKVIVGETEDEAKAMRDRLIADVPMEPVGVWLSHNTGFDMSTLPPRFSVRELNGDHARRIHARRSARGRRLCHDAGRHRWADCRLFGGDLRGDRQPRRLHARPFAMRTARPAAEYRRLIVARVAATRTVPHRLYRPDLAREPCGLIGRSR